MINSIKEFWYESGTDERIFIIGALAILVMFVGGFGYLLQLASYMDSLDRAARQ
jgi:hypothetical protein